jgi:iron complex transport system substrate-binding protein
MSKLRIASFLPSATEMICALGLFNQLIAISHECNYPLEVKQKPVVVKNAINYSSLTPTEIDQIVSQRIAEGQSLYLLDEKKLKSLAPTLIVSQELCKLCAVSGNEISKILKTLSPVPEILWQTPHSLEEVFDDLLILGEKTGTLSHAQTLVHHAQNRIKKIKTAVANKSKVRAFFIEWIDPIYCGGHWIHSLIDWAGGEDALAQPGKDSIRTPFKKVLDYDPDFIIVAPCGYDTYQSLQQAELLKALPEWNTLSAVKKKQVWVTASNAYFARPGLRLITGLEILAHLFHPDVIPWSGPIDAFALVT